MNHRSRRIHRAAIAVAALTLLAACSSSSSSSATTAASTTIASDAPGTTGAAAPETTGDAGSATTAAEAPGTSAGDSGTATTTAGTEAPADLLGPADPASGDAVKVGFMYESSAAIDETPMLDGAKAAASYANDHLKGIGGRPIDIVACNDQSTPAGASDCASQFVEGKVAAVLVAWTAVGGSAVPTLTAAGIPYVAFMGADPAEVTTAGSFSLAAGLPGALAAYALDAKAKGYQKVAIAMIDVPSATAGVNALAGIVFANAGVDFQVIAVPPGTPDMSPQLAAIAGSAEAVIPLGDVTFCQSFLQAYDAVGLTAAKYMIQPCLSTAVAEAMPSAFDGVQLITTTLYSPSDPEFQKYSAVLAQYSPSTAPVSNATGGYAVTLGLVSAASAVTDPTAANLLAALQASKDVPIELSGGITFSCSTPGIEILSGVCSTGLQITQLTGDLTMGEPHLIDGAPAFG